MQKSDWEHALERAKLTPQQKQQHRASIRWFLGYCRKRQPPAAPSRDLANEFDRRVLRNRNLAPGLLAQWRAGRRWLLEFWVENGGESLLTAQKSNITDLKSFSLAEKPLLTVWK